MIPCDKCRFAEKTDLPKWPIRCHHHSPTTLRGDDDAACWPVVILAATKIGCGDGRVKATP